MKNIITLVFFCGLLSTIHAQKPEETEDWSRKPAIVTPGKGTMPPSDAIVLYGGAADLDRWESIKGGPAGWIAGEGLTAKQGAGDIRTKQSFGDMQLHIEWRTPAEVKGEGQGRGNSGIFLMGLYEIQVLDSYENETYYNGQAGSVYKQSIPLVNACLPPGEWQSYDIIFKAPVFSADGSKKSPAYVTVIQNGVLVQNHVEIQGTTEFIGSPRNNPHPEKLPLLLQDHGNPVSFRNIWVREL